jgi:hypothetical protein
LKTPEGKRALSESDRRIAETMELLAKGRDISTESLHTPYRRSVETSARLNDTQCNDIIGELFDRGWEGITRDDIRMFETLIDSHRSAEEPFRDPSILWHTPDTTKGMSFCLPGCPACEFLDKQRAVKASAQEIKERRMGALLRRLPPPTEPTLEEMRAEAICDECRGHGRVNVMRIGNVVNIPCPKCSDEKASDDLNCFICGKLWYSQHTDRERADCSAAL